MKTLILLLAILFTLTNEYFSQTFPRNQTIEAGEYFINVDPGEGNGTPITATYGSSIVNITFDAQLTRGEVIYVRFKSSNGKWSAARGFKYKYKDLITAQYYIKYHTGVQTQWTTMSTPTNFPLNSPFFVSLSDFIDSLANNDSIFVRFQSDDYFWSPLSKISGGVVGIDEDDNTLPKEFELYSAYPNPFNPTSTIQYDIPKSSDVKLQIFDILGREVAALVNENKDAGNYSIEFNATDMASGIYFYRIQAGSFTDTKKFILMK